MVYIEFSKSRASEPAMSSGNVGCKVHASRAGTSMGINAVAAEAFFQTSFLCTAIMGLSNSVFTPKHALQNTNNIYNRNRSRVYLDSPGLQGAIMKQVIRRAPLRGAVQNMLKQSSYETILKKARCK